MSRGISLGGALILVGFSSVMAYAAEGGGDFLRYQEPQNSAGSFLSTFAYVITLLLTFAVVIGLAYFTSRFLGQKMGTMSSNAGGRIIATLPLGPNRTVNIVDLAGRVLVLGVTEHNISLLTEVTSPEEISRLREQAQNAAPQLQQFDAVFLQQITALRNLTHKFPTPFGGGKAGGTDEGDNERGKR